MSILKNIHPSWQPVLYKLHEAPLRELNTKILPNISYQPRPEHIFRALEQPVDAIKVTILGQDPYPTPGNAIGHAFAVPQNRTKPKSLQIIEREVLNTDPLNVNKGSEIDMNSWPDQGILLLNTALTVETGRAGSHLKYWKEFTGHLIRFLSATRPCIWLLWGKNAQSFEQMVANPRHHVKGYNRETIETMPMNPDWNYILKANHPAAEAYGSGGFYNRDHFYFVNRILALQGRGTIVW
jgi:uracil-DNA glycosylase